MVEQANEKHKNDPVPEDWPMRETVIRNRPLAYVLGKHVEDREVADLEIQKEGAGVDVQVVQEVTRYLVSNPTGDFNLAMTHKHKKVGSYQSISY